MALLFGIIFFYLIPTNNSLTPKTILVLNISIGYSLSFVWRLLYNHFIGAKGLHTNVIFIGHNSEVQELIDTIQNNLEGGFKIVAVVDPENTIKPADFPFFDVYHQIKAIRPAITNHQANLVVIAPHLRYNQLIVNELYELLFWKVHLTNLSSFYEDVTGRIPPSTFSESWFLDNLKNREQPIYDKVRELVDILAGLIIGLGFALIFPFVALAIKFSSRGPIFYKQERIGQGGKIFYLFKFRSMFALSADGSAETNGVQFATKGDERITKIGRILRRTRLDEVPQFINLLKRDITLIGPRPERPEIIRKLEEKMIFYSLRHVVKPGLTGWAVIHQNYTDSLEKYLQKLQYDLYYIKNRSLLLDLSILLRTVNLIVRLMGQ